MKGDNMKVKRFIKTDGYGGQSKKDTGVSLTPASSGKGLVLRVNDGVGWGEVILTPAQAQELGDLLKEDAEPQP